VQIEIPPASFLANFLQLNNLEDISHLLLRPGMLFQDTAQWWRAQNQQPPSNLRPHPHEGLDIYQLQNMDGAIIPVWPNMLIPAILTGNIVYFHRDFLGETLYIRHPDRRQGQAVLHTIYGHVCPAITLRTGPCRINKGQLIATISNPEAVSVPAHLHISCAWIDEDQAVAELTWRKMGTGSTVVFIDPLPFLL